MAYPLRVQVEGGTYHVWTNATDGAWLAADDEDRTRFVRLLRRVVGKFGWRCCMFCVLGSHYHLVLVTPEANLAAGMQWLNGVYALGFNKRHDRRGHLVRRRYCSKLVESDEHAHELCRYVPLNPVRAGLCASPETWKWSSYPATLGRAAVPTFLDTSWVLDRFGGDVQTARRNLDEWVRAGLPEPSTNLDYLRGG